MNKSAALFISVILLTQIASYSFNEIQSDSTSETTLQDDSNWDASGRNNTTGANNNSTSDAHCLVLNNLTMNQTYYVSIYLVNTCSDGINYPGINASSDNSGVDGLGEMWWYVIPGANTNSSNISDYPYYHMSYQLSLNQSIPNGTTITLYFEATVLHCGPNNSWSNDCPNSNNSNLSYQFTYPLGYNSTNNNGNNITGNNTGGNETSGNNTAGNNTGDDANNSIHIPDYYMLNTDFLSDGFDFYQVTNIMNGTWVSVSTAISNNDSNYSFNFDHMLAFTYHTDGHSEEEQTFYSGPTGYQSGFGVGGGVLITHETTFVELSFDVLTCLNETCDLTVPVEERFHPVDPQYHKSYTTTDIPTVVELSDEIFDLEPKTEEEQQNGIEVPRFTFEMEEVDLYGEMYYRIVVTSCQMDLATHHIFVTVYWSDDSGTYGTNKWNLADPNRVYGFYPGNSYSTVTFLDQVDYNGGSLVSTFGVGDIIFIKSENENGTTNDMISITYDMYPEEDDAITVGAILSSWDFGGGSIISDDDNSEDNTDDNDTEDESESSGLPSIGILGTLAVIGLSFVAVIRRDQEE
ncbi:hypothetical protein OAU99_03115 [Candidatus Poseidoniaceae archaeon]|jgi:hypothetical protein|nr:hypothetical protein [Candidatus Poseidoniaceae archaeon]